MFNWPIESTSVGVAVPVTSRTTPRQVGFSKGAQPPLRWHNTRQMIAIH